MHPNTRFYKLMRIAILIAAALAWMGPPRPPGLPGCWGPRPPRPPMPFHETAPAPSPR